MRKSGGGANATSSLRSTSQVTGTVRQAVILLEDAAHPDIGRGLEIGAADRLADEVLGLADAGLGIDEEKTMAKAPVEKDRQARQRHALVVRHEMRADIDLAHVELQPPRHPPMTLARSHAGEHGEIDPVRPHRAFFERAHDLIVAARQRQLEPVRH